MNKNIASAFAALLTLAAVSGCGKGKTGSQGAVGPSGPVGPTGPVVDAPRIDSIAPPAATSSTKIRIRGSGFSPTVADDAVLVNGVPATVVSATGTEIWATGLPSPSYSGSDAADVTVVVNGQNSNNWHYRLGLAGDVFNVPQPPVNSIGATVLDEAGTSLYIAEAAAYDDVSGNDYGAIYKLDLASGELTTAFMDHAYYYISALAWGPDGKLYFGAEDWETGEQNVYRFDTLFDANAITVVAKAATCSDVTHLAWNPAGDLYMADYCDEVHVLRKSDNQFFYDVFDLNADPAGLFYAGGAITTVDTSGYVYRLDNTLPYANGTYLNSIGTTLASATDGTNVFLLSQYNSGLIYRVSPSADTSAILPSSQWLDNYSNSNPDNGNGLVRTKDGDFFFTNGNDQMIVKIARSGAVEDFWLTPYNGNASFGQYAGNGVFITNFDYGCDYGVGAPIMKQTLDGRVMRLASDVCGNTNMAMVNNLLYAADSRGFILQIDPETGAESIASTDPALAYPLGFAADGSNFYVGVANTAGTYDILKIGTGDAPAPATILVSGLDTNPNYMIVVGGELYWSAYDAVGKVPVAGGSPAWVIAPNTGWYGIFSVGDAGGGKLFLTNYNDGTYAVDGQGTITPATYSPIWSPAADEFGGITGFDNNNYVFSQVLQ